MKSVSRPTAASIALAFSQVQEAKVFVSSDSSRKYTLRTYWKTSCHMGRLLPSPGGSQLPNVHRYILRQDELLTMMLAIGPQKHQTRMIICLKSDLTGRERLTARASGAAHGVLGRSLVARAVEGVLLAAGALGLGSADTAAITRGLAAGGGRVDHFDWMLV